VDELSELLLILLFLLLNDLIHVEVVDAQLKLIVAIEVVAHSLAEPTLAYTIRALNVH
jgi:hypothetical protein